MTMILRFATAGVLAVGAMAGAPHTLAHHSSAGFESEDVVEVSGVIKEFQFRNPHSWIQVMVPDEDGNEVEWSIEWGSPNTLFRSGYNQSTFPAGAEVSMRFHPAVNGAPFGGFVGARMSDGTIVGEWDDE